MCADNISCISEFRPDRFPSARMIYKFLHSLYRYHLCCFITGTNVLFASGCLDSFDGMSVFITITDAPLFYFIFQKIHSPNFLLDDFTFNLVNVDEHDIFHYIVSSEDFNMPVTISEIDTTKHCGPLSNIDLVHFVWEHFLRFSYKTYALALPPRGATKIPKLFPNYFRAKSDAWKDTVNCADCVERHMAVINPFHAFDLTPECTFKYVRVNLLPLQIPPDTFCSITLFILTGLNLL